jgi:membrane-bound lytic murein transglycosylase D
MWYIRLPWNHIRNLTIDIVKEFITMPRRSGFLLPILAIVFILCHSAFIGSAHGQGKAKNEPYDSSVRNQKISIGENKHNNSESSGNEDPSLDQKQKEKHDKDASVEKKELPVKKVQKDQEGEKGSDIMEEALILLNESRAYWVKGDLENALDLLDQAYALLLDVNGDSDISRQKDDLRLLISKQLLAIYSSKHTTTSGKRSEIPYIINADIEKEIRLFQTIEKEFFVQSYRRSAFYRPIILRELKKAGLPEELSWLPLVESGFKAHALSSARALGLWQFIPSTGYKYGLSRDEWIDERLDLEKSTRAAIDYLKELHSMFGDWLTVLAAYNCGEGRVLKVISRQHINYFDRFWDLYHQLPYETARYVPRFLATLHIIRDPKKYGIDLSQGAEKQVSYLYETVKTNKSMRLQDIAVHLGISEEIVVSLNAELRQKITPDKEYGLKIPPGLAGKFTTIVDDIPKCEKPRQVFITYRAKRAESVVSIARRYRTSVSAIMDYNHISGRKKVKAGQRLIIPVSTSRYAKVKPTKRPDRNKIQASADNIVRYKVKKGDTLTSLARRHETTVDEIKRLNKFKKHTALKPGQVIVLSRNEAKQQNSNPDKSDPKKGSKKGKVSTTNAASKTYTVRKGDSLEVIAKKNGVSLDKILEINNLGKDDNIHPGQVIVVK